MTQADPEPTEQATYWNEDGGRRWLANMDSLETILDGLGRRLLERVGARPGERVLDIGCGGGVTSAALAAAVTPGGHVLGVDISAPILTAARERHAHLANLRFVTADAGSDDLPEAAFDIVTSRFGVMFFHEPLIAFRHIRRAAAPGARLVFLCWRRYDENPWMNIAASAAFTIVPPPPKPAADAPGPFALADADKVQNLLMQTGFADIAMTPIDLPLNLGSLETAVQRMTQFGPAAQPLREATPERYQQALVAMRAALAPHDTPAGIVLNGATWLVEARAN